MATETPLESSQSGEAELPTPQFSEKSDSSTSSGADEIVSKLLPHLEQIIERKVQSTKDKRFSDIEKALGGRSKILAELESEGVAIPKEVRTQMQIRELEERLAGQSSQPAPERVDGSTQQKAAVTEAIAELKDNGLTTDDPAVIEVFRGKYGSRAEFDLAIQKYINQKLRSPKPANPADVVQPPVRSSATGVTADSIEKGYLDAIAKVPRGNTHQVSQVKAEWRKKAREAGFNLNV